MRILCRKPACLRHSESERSLASASDAVTAIDPDANMMSSSDDSISHSISESNGVRRMILPL